MARAEPLGAGLRAADAGAGHDRDDAPGSRGQRAERVNEFEGAEEVRRDRDLAPILDATLEGLDADGAGVEIVVLAAEGEDLGDAGVDVGQGEREGLVGGLLGAGRGGLEEANRRSSLLPQRELQGVAEEMNDAGLNDAFRKRCGRASGGEVFTAAGVDQANGLGVRHFG